MKKDRIFVLSGIVLAFLFLHQGCNNSDEETDLINYSELDEIATEVLLEIGHRDGDPIFGALIGLVVFEDGSMVVGDRGTRRIEQFSEDGSYVGAVANQGDGPGELSPLFELVLGGEESLIVHHFGMENRVDYFVTDPDGDGFLYEDTVIQEAVMDHRNLMLGALSSDRYLVRVTEILRLSELDQVADRGVSESVLAVVDHHQTLVRDSISTLKSPLAIFNASGRGVSIIGIPPYQDHDRVKVLRGGRYLIAKPDSSELTFYNDQSEMDHQITLKVAERGVTEEEIREFLSDHDREHHQKFRSRIPEVKPPFLDVWASDRHILLKTDEVGEEQEFVLLNREGDPLGRFHLSTFDDIRWIEGDRIYSLHQHPEEGHSIRVYGLNL